MCAHCASPSAGASTIGTSSSRSSSRVVSLNRVGEPLRAGLQSRGLDRIAALLGGHPALFSACSRFSRRSATSSALARSPPRRTPSRNEVMFEELREPLDDPNQVGNLDAVGGGVRLVSRPLHRRREVPVQPVVRVDGDDASSISAKEMSRIAARSRKSAFPITRPIASRCIKRLRRLAGQSVDSSPPSGWPIGVDSGSGALPGSQSPILVAT